jgi:hypothetical protein
MERVLGVGRGRRRRIYFLRWPRRGPQKTPAGRTDGGGIMVFAEIEGEAHNSLDQQCGMRYACLQQNTDKAEARLPQPNYLIRPNPKFLRLTVRRSKISRRHVRGRVCGHANLRPTPLR